jgi:WAS family protein 3
MPLAARSVTPVDIAQNRIPPGLKGDELECVANGTMANLMRQMSSLGLHAVQIFGDIQKEVLAQDRRIERIHDRLSRLQENLANQQEFFPPPQNNGALDGRRKAFKSSMIIDQHTLDRSTLPPAMLELYNKCEDPPNLDLLNPYRDDSKSALKLYTNPDYFFDLWKEEMLKEDPSIETKRTARAAKSPERNGSPTKKRKQRTSTSATRHGAPVQSNVVLGHYQQQRMQQQNEQFMHFPSEYQAPELLRNNNIAYEKENQNDMPPPPGMSMPASVQPTRIAPGRPSAAAQQQQHSRDMVSNFQGLNLTHSNDLGLIDEDDDELPPPPPPLSDHHTNILPNLNSPSAYSSTSTMPLMTALAGSPMKLIEAPAAIPPSNDNDILPPPPSTLSSSMGSAPPPPPPPPPIASMSLMTSSTLIQATSFGGSNTAPSIGNDMAVKEGAGLNVHRGNLLAEIQAGMKLRKTQIQKEKEEEAAAVKKNDVAAILRQRMKKVTTSISDDEEDDDDDGDWE